MNHHDTRRGQFEIMGLAILVVIILIGAAFFLTRPSRTDTSAIDYEYDQLAQSTVDTFLKTDVGASCPGITMYDLVRDAAMTNENPCGTTPDMASKAILDTTARAIMGNLTNTKYNFRITSDAGGSDIVAITRCIGIGRAIDLGRRAEAKVRLLPLKQTATVSLQFCPGAA